VEEGIAQAIPFDISYGSLIKQLYGYLCLTSNLWVAYTRYMNWDKDAIFKALSDSTRRLILDELSERNEQTLYELTVRLISKHDLSISRQAIAKHLSVLEDAGLVKSERKGKYRVLVFNNEPLKNLLKGWIE
jgi:DNA-binding transcriptional ArsR family regulator